MKSEAYITKMDFVTGLQFDASERAARRFETAALSKDTGTALAAVVVQSKLSRRGVVSYVCMLTRNRRLAVSERKIIQAPQAIALTCHFLKPADVDAVANDGKLG